MNRKDILDIINIILKNKGRNAGSDESLLTRDAQFRSLDFSELALRVESVVDMELSFEAADMRKIETIKDVLDFFYRLTNNEETR